VYTYLDKWQISFCHLNFVLGLIFFVIHSSEHFLNAYFIITNSCDFTVVLGLFSKLHYHLKLQRTVNVTLISINIYYFKFLTQSDIKAIFELSFIGT
jgi:hypothetical protein